ncbi:MAG: B12-binding domain-containing protein [Actinobacteria bacterium]|nr:B12-binding domain-containing protein [Actinomycetota bacterium]
MTQQELFDAAKAAVVAADEDQAVAVAQEAVAMGLDPVRVIAEGFTPGMREVGDLFERGTMFLPEVIIASEAMVAAVAVLEAHLPADKKEKKAGVVVIGTIEGDVHDIGKGIVATLMRVYGFEVHDLGRDVPLVSYVQKAREVDATIIGSSALMTTTMMGQKTLEKLLKEADIRDRVRTMVGGAVVTQYWADKIGADAYAENAQEAVQKALELVAG